MLLRRVTTGTVGRLVAVGLALMALAGPIAGVSLEAVDAVEVEAKAGLLEIEDLVAQPGPGVSVHAHAVVDLGPHAATRPLPTRPYREVPENPPEGR